MVKLISIKFLKQSENESTLAYDALFSLLIWFSVSTTVQVRQCKGKGRNISRIPRWYVKSFQNCWCVKWNISYGVVHVNPHSHNQLSIVVVFCCEINDSVTFEWKRNFVVLKD